MDRDFQSTASSLCWSCSWTGFCDYDCIYGYKSWKLCIDAAVCCSPPYTVHHTLALWVGGWKDNGVDGGEVGGVGDGEVRVGWAWWWGQVGNLSNCRHQHRCCGGGVGGCWQKEEIMW